MDAIRLQQIAQEVRAVPSATANSFLHPEEVAGVLFAEALKLGAFSGSEYANLRALVNYQLSQNPVSYTAVWDEAVHCLTSVGDERDLGQWWIKACGPIGEMIDAELCRAEKPAVSPPQDDGPEPPCCFWWQGKRHELDIDDTGMEWKLLVCLWGKPSIAISEVGRAVWGNKTVPFSSMKSTLSRLNAAMSRGDLPFSWSKKRGKNQLDYSAPSR